MSKKLLKNIVDNKNLLLLLGMYSLSLILIFGNLYLEIKAGGTGWHQGDWLINNEIINIRRGFFGSFLLDLSKILNVNPLYMLAALQALIIFILHIVFFFIGVKFRDNDIVFFLLFSPLFILFWFNDVAASLRKDIIVYLSFIPFIILVYENAYKKQSNVIVATVLSLCIYTVAVFSHEANVFFLPFLLIAFYIICGKIDQKFLIFSLFYIAIAIIGFSYSIKYSHVNDYMLVCEPILKQGINSNICSGAIQWLTKDSNSAISLSKQLLHSKAALAFLISYLFSLLLLVSLLKNYFPIKNILISCFLSSLCFLPLYIVGLDWGRWINYYVFSVTFVVILYFLIHKNSYLYFKLTKFNYILLLIVCSVFSMPHYLPIEDDEIPIARGYLYKLFYKIPQKLAH